MDSTPIYTELSKTLIDPEGDHWDTSAPPEFAASLESANERQDRTESEGAHSGGSHSAGESTSGSGRRSKGRRHRAED